MDMKLIVVKVEEKVSGLFARLAVRFTIALKCYEVKNISQKSPLVISKSVADCDSRYWNIFKEFDTKKKWKIIVTLSYFSRFVNIWQFCS